MFTSETLFVRLLWRTHPPDGVFPAVPTLPFAPHFCPSHSRSHTASAMSSWAFPPCGQPSHERSVSSVLLSTTRVFGATSSRVFHKVLQFALPQPPLQFPPLLVGKRLGGVVCVDEVVVNPRSHRLSCCAQLNTRHFVVRRWHCPRCFPTVCLPFCYDVPLAVVCIQETHAPAFAALPNDQPYRYDGPCDSGGSEAGFLFHETVTATSIPGLPDTLRIRWRLMSGRICVCSFYAPHCGMDAQCRTRFWEELVASVRHTQQTLPATPIVLCGDANVWLPEFRLNRERQRYHVVLPVCL